MAFFGKAVLEKRIFENGGHIHVYNHGSGADNPLCFMFSLSNDFVTFFPIQTYMRPNLTLS